MEDTLELDAPPPGAKEGITRMADAFRSKMAEALPENTKPGLKGATKAREQGATSASSPHEPGTNGTPTASPAREQTANGDEPVPDTIRGKAAEAWKRFRGSFNDLKAEKIALEKRLAEVEQLKTSREQVEELQARLTLAEDVVQRHFLGEDPRFKEHYSARTSAVIAEAKQSAGELAAEVEDVLSRPPSKMRDEKIQDLASQLGEFERVALVGSYRDLTRLESEREVELGKAKENLTLLRQHQEQQQQAATLDAMQKRAIMFGHVSSRIDEEMSGMDDGLASEAKGRVRSFLDNKLNAEQYAELLIDSARAKRAVVVEAQLREEISKLQDQVSELTSAQPGVNGMGGSPPLRKTPGPPDPTGREMGNRYRAELSRRTTVGVR